MIRAGNRVLLLLVLLGGAAMLATGFLSEAPNRLLSGQPLMLWQAAGAPLTLALAALGLALLAAALLPQRPLLHRLVLLLAALLILVTLEAAGLAAASLARQHPPAARTALGPAVWIVVLCAALAIVDALQRLRSGPAARALVALMATALVAALLASGQLDALSILREYAARHGAFWSAMLRHCTLVLWALIPALLIGAPLGLLAHRRAGAKAPLLATLNLLQTIPSVALFGLLIAPLSALAKAVPGLGALGIAGIGAVPAVIALVLYALLPVVRNTEAGLAGVDPAVRESAAGMGFTPAQRLWQVELPLALPAFLAGIRIVLVQAIGLAVIAALIGAGGLGTFVFQGLGQYALDLVLLGAVPTILLALAADLAMRLLITLAERRRAP